MNLIEYRNKISSTTDDKSVLSESVTICNILNGLCNDNDIIQINQDHNKFDIQFANEYIAEEMVNKINEAIIPGAFSPFYKIIVYRESCSLKITLNEI